MGNHCAPPRYHAGSRSSVGATSDGNDFRFRDILIFGTLLIYEDGENSSNLESYFKLPDEELLEQGDQRMAYTNVCFWNKLWRRAFVMGEHGVAFPEGLIHEDEYFYRCLAPHARGMYVLPHAGYNYVQRLGSIMHADMNRWQRLQARMPIIEKVLQYHAQSGSLQQAREFILPFWLVCLDSVSVAECPSEWAAQARSRNALISSAYKLRRVFPGDFLLSRLLPNPWWQRLFMKVHRNRVSYRFFGMPLFSVVYEDNRPVRRESAWMNLGRRCLGR